VQGEGSPQIEDVMMFIMFEYATCLLVALIGGTFLFTLSAMCVMFWSAGDATWRQWRLWASVPKVRTAVWTPEPREP
jgi:hypothetical protein